MLPGQLTVLIDIEEKRCFRKKKLQPSEIKKTDSKDSWEYYREDNRHTLMRCDLVLCQDEKLQMPLYLETVLLLGDLGCYMMDFEETILR